MGFTMATSSNDFLPMKDQPLVMKRDTRTAFLKLLNNIHDNLKTYLSQVDRSLKRTFFGVSSKELATEKKKIIEDLLTNLKELRKNSSHIPWEDAIRNLGDILLKAKFQSLAYYIKYLQRPLDLDKSLDDCIKLFVNQAVKVKSSSDIQEILQSLLVVHHAIATKQLYDKYSEKSLEFCKRHDGDEAFSALTRFHQQLDSCNKTFEQGLNQYMGGLLDPLHLPIINPELLPKLIQFLNEQSEVIIGLEPASSDLKIPDVSKIYMWGVTAVSKLGAYVRGLNHDLNEPILLFRNITSL